MDNDEDSFYSCCREIALLRLHYARKKQANTDPKQLHVTFAETYSMDKLGVNPPLFKSVWVANTLPSPLP
jgi:hypothetical protein